MCGNRVKKWPKYIQEGTWFIETTGILSLHFRKKLNFFIYPIFFSRLWVRGTFLIFRVNYRKYGFFKSGYVQTQTRIVQKIYILDAVNLNMSSGDPRDGFSIFFVYFTIISGAVTEKIRLFKKNRPFLPFFPFFAKYWCYNIININLHLIYLFGGKILLFTCDINHVL